MKLRVLVIVMPLVKEYEAERRKIRKARNNEEREWEMKAGRRGAREGGHWYSDSAAPARARLLLVSVNASVGK